MIDCDVVSVVDFFYGIVFVLNLFVVVLFECDDVLCQIVECLCVGWECQCLMVDDLVMCLKVVLGKLLVVELVDVSVLFDMMFIKGFICVYVCVLQVDVDDQFVCLNVCVQVINIGLCFEGGLGELFFDKLSFVKCWGGSGCWLIGVLVVVIVVVGVFVGMDCFKQWFVM